jgi:hypothetical protein
MKLIRQIASVFGEARDKRRLPCHDLRDLVKPDIESRLYIPLGKKQLRFPEWPIIASLVAVWVIGAGLLIAETFHDHASSIIYEHKLPASIILVVALVCLLLILGDLASYRPRLFALAERSGTRLISEFGDRSGDFGAVLLELNATPPTKFSEMPDWQQKIQSVISQYVEIGVLRSLIATRIIHRLGVMLAALALVAYALSTLTGGEVIDHAPHNAGLAEHAYFVTVQSVTIGFGDVYPQHGPWGYGILALSVLIMAAIVYFVLAEIVASQAQFRSDLQMAVERYVVGKAEI